MPENPRIFAHIRSYEDDVALCVHNLASSAQAVELDLSLVRGLPRRSRCSAARASRGSAQLPYLLTLAPRGFYWFLLEKEEGRRVMPSSSSSIPRRCAPGSSSSAGTRPSRARSAQLNLLEVAPLDGDEPEPLMALALVEARFHAGTHELYQLPLGFRHVDEGWSDGVIAQVGDRTMYDAMVDPALRAAARRRRCARATRIEHEDGVWTFALTDGAAVGRRAVRRAPGRRRAVELVDRASATS